MSDIKRAVLDYSRPGESRWTVENVFALTVFIVLFVLPILFSAFFMVVFSLLWS